MGSLLYFITRYVNISNIQTFNACCINNGLSVLCIAQAKNEPLDQTKMNVVIKLKSSVDLVFNIRCICGNQEVNAINAIKTMYVSKAVP